MEGWEQNVDYILHASLEFNLVQDIAIYRSKHSLGYLVCVPMSLASFG